MNLLVSVHVCRTVSGCSGFGAYRFWMQFLQKRQGSFPPAPLHSSMCFRADSSATIIDKSQQSIIGTAAVEGMESPCPKSLPTAKKRRMASLVTWLRPSWSSLTVADRTVVSTIQASSDECFRTEFFYGPVECLKAASIVRLQLIAWADFIAM